MAFLVMADNNITITAKRDGALYNVALNDTSLIIKDIGNEFSLSLDGLNLTVGTGEAILKGRHVTAEATNTLTLPASSSGYVVLRLDLTQTAGSEAYLYATPVLTQEEINNTGHIYDLPLCTFTSTLQSATITDARVIDNKAGGSGSVDQDFTETQQGTPTLTNADLLGGTSKENLGINMDLLWTNPSPTSAFSNQTVSLELANYKMFVLYFRVNKSLDVTFDSVSFKGEHRTCQFGSEYYRYFSIDDNGVTFDGYKYTDNAIPYKIYGIK